MNRYVKLLDRMVRARRFGVWFCGMSHTRLPEMIRLGGARRRMIWPDEPLVVADFVNVVLDDDYGLRGLDKNLRTVVDIGANIGIFCNWARDCFPDATIHAYEPSPKTAAIAKANTNDPGTTIFVEGVSANDGRAEMVELGSSNLAQTVATADGGIVLTSFAHVLQRIGGHIDLLKIDCEGAEWDFMQDASLFAQVDHIRMEYHLTDGRTLGDLRQMADGIGFTITRLVENQGFGIAWLKSA